MSLSIYLSIYLSLSIYIWYVVDYVEHVLKTGYQWSVEVAVAEELWEQGQGSEMMCVGVQ